jgi:hypothetical protein
MLASANFNQPLRQVKETASWQTPNNQSNLATLNYQVDDASNFLFANQQLRNPPLQSHTHNPLPTFQGAANNLQINIERNRHNSWSRWVNSCAALPNDALSSFTQSSAVPNVSTPPVINQPVSGKTKFVDELTLYTV